MTTALDFKSHSIEALRHSGSRVTKQRIAVIECIATASKPLTAPEVFEKLSKRSSGAPLDKVSVYRVLDTLLELNLVHRIAPSGAYIACNHRSCTNVHHILSRCTECEEVKELDVPNEVVAPLLFHMKSAFQFVPDSHLLCMDGVCVDCGGGTE